HVPASLAPEVSTSLAVFALSMFAFSMTQVLNGALIGFQRLDLSNLCFLSGLTLHTTILVLALWQGFGLVGAAAAAVSGHLVSGAIAAVLARRELRHVPRRGAELHVTWRELLQF